MSKIIVNKQDKKSTINKNIYGNFSEHLGRCIYNGIYVGEDSSIPNVNGMRTDVVEALRHIKLPVLRWPGGCFADEYHWKDGIGPKAGRKRMVNTATTRPSCATTATTSCTKSPWAPATMTTSGPTP